MKKEIIQAIKEFDILKLELLLEDDKSYMEVSKKDFLKAMKQSFDDARAQGLNQFDDTFFGICGSCLKGCEGITFYGSKRLQYLDLVIEGSEDHVLDITCCGDLQNFNELEKQIDLGFSFYDDEKLTYKPSEVYKSHKQIFCEFLEELNVNVGTITIHNLVKTFNTYEQIDGFFNGSCFARAFRCKLYSDISRFSQITQIYITIYEKSEHAINALIEYHNAKTERDKVLWYFENRSDLLKVFDLSNKDAKLTKTKKHDIDGKVLIVDWSEFEYVVDYFDKLDSFYFQMCEKYNPLHSENDDYDLLELEEYFKLSNVYLDLLAIYGKNED